MNVLSLFAGIGGLDLGLERAGMTVVGQVEIDSYCQKVLAKHWPEVPRHDDVRTAVAWWRGAVRPAVDVVAGGYPCQPFSSAGLRRGTADARWGWPWMREVISAVRPRHVVAENVAAHLRDTAAFHVVLDDLSALGFDIRWDVVSACSVGASHARERLFLLADAAGDDVPDQGALPLREGWVRPESRGSRGAARARTSRWLPEPAVDRVAHGLPSGMVRDQLASLGNAVVPQVAEHIGRLVMEVSA